jgi:hypothetical protein
MTCILSASVANARCNPNVDGQRTVIHNDKKAIHKEKMNIFRDLLKEMKD